MATNNKIPKCPPLRFPNFNDEWKETTLGEICSVLGGGTPRTEIQEYWNGDIQWFTPSEIGLNKFVSYSDRTITTEGLNNSGAKLLPIGTILLTTRATIGEMSIATTPCTTNQGFQSLVADSRYTYTEFIYQKVKTLKNELFTKANGSTFKEISATEIRSLALSLPTLAEQKKIADFLSLIDERIANLSETIKELKTQKAGLLNQLFSQKLRFPDFNDDWTQTTLGEIAERVTRKNNGHVTSRPLTISAQYGLIDQRDFFNKIVASTSLEGYYLLNKGEFAYNRSSSADYPWGAIKRLESYENGALSTLYICFSLLQGYPSFIAHFFETSQWHEYIQSIAAEGARNHGLLNISVSDFFALPISLPTLKEQKKIADFLSLIDERIEVEEQLLQQYEKQKRYLLKQMFV